MRTGAAFTEMSETATCARNCNPTVWKDLDALETLVDCQALEEHDSDVCQGEEL